MRKGPQHVPASTSVLLFSVGLLLFAFSCSVALVPASENDNISTSFLITVTSYVVYWIVLVVTGYSRRLVPAISSIMACGSILMIFQVAAYTFLRPFLSDNMTAIVTWLILIWAIPVKGHIIARSIEQHWYTGIAIALTIFVMQNVAYVALIRSSLS